MKHSIIIKDSTGKIIKTIKATLKAESIGNFNPIFCQYKKQKYLVKSEEGDLSDPFRRTESYLNTLYITLDIL